MDDKLNSADNAKDLKFAANEYYDVQRKIEDSLKKQNVNLLSMIGDSKKMSTNIIDIIKRTNELTKNTEKAAQHRKQLEDEFGTATGVRKAEIKQSIESIVQRQAGYDAELELLQNIAKSGWIPISFIVGETYKLFMQMDKAAFDFRIKMGATRESVSSIRNVSQKLAIEFMHIGVTIDGIYSSIISLGQEYGSILLVSKDLIKTTAILKAQLGISEESSAGFFKNMAAISGSTMESQKDMGYMAAYMAQAAGIPLSEIMTDVAKMTSTTLTMISRVPNQILRSAIEARRLNTNINDIAKGGRDILNFTDNVNAEMEASVLLGRSINLQKARQLAYNKNLIGLNNEILHITKQINFDKLDVFQQEAFARATGRSVDELLKMVQANREWNNAKMSGNAEIQKQVKAIEAMRNADKSTILSETEKLKISLQTMANQERINAIHQKWNQLIAKTFEIFLPIVDVVLSLAIPMIDFTRGLFAAIGATGILLKFTSMLFYVFGNGMKILTIFPRIASFMTILSKSMGAFVKPLFSFFGLFGKIGPFIGAFGKFIPLIGWIITGLTFISNIIKRFNEIEFVKGDWMGNIWKGLKAVGSAIYDTLIQPFVDAWNFVKPWLGHSPSQIGLSIVKGLLSVGAMIFDALTSPWRLAMAWIMDKIPGMSNVATKLRGGISGMLNTPVENKIAASYIPAVQVTSNGNTILNPEQRKTTSESEDSKKSKYSMDDVYDMLKLLNDNLIGGKVKAGDVYLDSSLVSSVMSRELSFRGSFGTNR